MSESTRKEEDRYVRCGETHIGTWRKLNPEDAEGAISRGIYSIFLRASPAVPRLGPRTPFFTSERRYSALPRPPIPRFHPDLGFHPSGEPRPSLAFRGALGDSGQNQNARNGEQARGVGERKGSSPPLILFPSKNAPHIPIFPAEIPHSCRSSSSLPPLCRRSGSPTTAR
jgi:hypothetical protein